MIKEQDRGLLLNITGNGKGKSTSAFGTAIRALGWGWPVAILQFVKGGMETGEKLFFSKFPSEQLIFEQLGCGLSYQPGDHAGLARQGWERAKELLHDDRIKLLILDELNIALHYRWLALPEVMEALQQRRPDLNVVVTGRYAPPELLAISDLVSEIAAVKHPFEQGIPARKGVDF